MIWGAAWLFKATKNPIYSNYVLDNIHKLEKAVMRNVNGLPYSSLGGSFAEFGWDSKHAGVNVLASKVYM